MTRRPIGGFAAAAANTVPSWQPQSRASNTPRPSSSRLPGPWAPDPRVAPALTNGILTTYKPLPSQEAAHDLTDEAALSVHLITPRFPNCIYTRLPRLFLRGLGTSCPRTRKVFVRGSSRTTSMRRHWDVVSTSASSTSRTRGHRHLGPALRQALLFCSACTTPTCRYPERVQRRPAAGRENYSGSAAALGPRPDTPRTRSKRRTTQ